MKKISFHKAICFALFFSPVFTKTVFSNSFNNPNIIENKLFFNSGGEDVLVFINNSNIPLRAVEKRFISNSETQTQKYLDAVKLQSYAKQLFDSGDYVNSLIASNKSRQIAIEELTRMTSFDYASHYNHFENEKNSFEELTNDTSTIQSWVEKANQNIKN